MLEDGTVHTGTQKSRVYCSLPWKKVSSCGYLDSGRWSVRSMMLNCTTCYILKTVPGPGPSFPAAQLSSTCGWLRSAKWKVWVDKRCEVEAKKKMFRQPESVQTGGCDQWPQAMECETSVPSALGQPSSVQWGHRPSLKALPGGRGMPPCLLFKS